MGVNPKNTPPSNKGSGKKFETGLVGKDPWCLRLLSWEECNYGVSGTRIAYKHQKGCNKDLHFYFT